MNDSADAGGTSPPTADSQQPEAGAASGSLFEDSGSPSPGFNFVRVFTTVFTLIVVGGAGYLVWLLIGPSPKLVEATGRVEYQGKPVTVGAVLTVPEKQGLGGALGKLDEEGRFSLMTNGKPGAFTGRHRLVVSSFGEGGMPPPPLVPAIYTSVKESPLMIEIGSDPAENNFEFVLEDPPGGEEEPQNGAGPNRPPGPPPGAVRGAAGERPENEEDAGDAAPRERNETDSDDQQPEGNQPTPNRSPQSPQ